MDQQTKTRGPVASFPPLLAFPLGENMVGRALCSAAASSAAKVVVVGGSGFVGSALCKAAVARGADVFSVSRGGKPGAKQLADSSWAREVTWLKGDALNVSPSSPHLTSRFPVFC